MQAWQGSGRENIRASFAGGQNAGKGFNIGYTVASNSISEGSTLPDVLVGSVFMTNDKIMELFQNGSGQSGGGGDRNLSDPNEYPGINIYQNDDKSDMTAVTLPGFGIYIGGGYSGRNLTRVMQHEYGHYLDYKFSPNLNFRGHRFLNFYFLIGIPSLFNATTGLGGSHKYYWTEIRANQWAEIWFGKNLDPDFLKNFPTK